MTDSVKHIVTQDCLPFNDSNISADILQTFLESQQDNIFRLSNNVKNDEESLLAEYDYRYKKWFAGRFVGEATFNYHGQKYKITIKPRFGENFLLRMLEEIYNIRITKSENSQKQPDDWNHYIKRIIAFIWIQKLANANLHGLPKKQIKKQYKGATVKGRINIRKTIIPYYSNNEIISTNREKMIVNTVAKILLQAYYIIRKDFGLGVGVNIPDTAQNAINQIKTLVNRRDKVTLTDYKNIKYNAIYLNWKPVVDFSWDIIQRKRLSLKQENSNNGFGFFIDIAEIWEQYLRSLLQKKLKTYGWYLKIDKQIAYKGRFYQRELIPDLIFQKNNELIVYDAKYKRMNGIHWDVDRADFFQIHTYIQNFLNKYKVKSGGLLYPISSRVTDFSKYRSNKLLNKNGINVNFLIDGIVLQENKSNENIKKLENDFIERIIESVN